MSAMYWVTFDCGSMLQIGAADAKSMKRADLRAATQNAAKRAKARLVKQMPSKAKAKVVNVRCVG